MISSLMNRSQSNTTAASSKHDSPVDSIHDQTVRPVHIIEENKASSDQNHAVESGEENCKVSNEEANEPNSFDEVSLSTRSSYQQVPVETVFVHSEEETILSGHDEFGHHEAAATVHSKEGTTQKDQGEATPKETDDDDLSFNVDRAVVDGSILDHVLEDFIEKEPDAQETYPGAVMKDASSIEDANPATTNKSNDAQDKSVDNFNNQAFTDVGKAMFKQQPDTQNSKTSSIGSIFTHSLDASAAKKKLFYTDMSSANSIVSYANIMLLIKTVLAFFTFYGFTTFMSNIKANYASPDRIQDNEACSEEAFHYAMYHLSSNGTGMTFTKCEGLNGQSFGFSTSFTAITTLIFYHGTIHLYKHFMESPTAKTIEHQKEDQMKEQQGAQTTKMTPRHETKLKRELDSLGKKHVFVSTFSTEVVSPTGKISSVKRSSRRKTSSSKIEESKIEQSEATGVNLLASFDVEPASKGSAMKSKVNA